MKTLMFILVLIVPVSVQAQTFFFGSDSKSPTGTVTELGGITFYNVEGSFTKPGSSFSGMAVELGGVTFYNFESSRPGSSFSGMAVDLSPPAQRSLLSVLPPPRPVPFYNAPPDTWMPTSSSDERSRSYAPSSAVQEEYEKELKFERLRKEAEQELASRR